jgi:hypothetical protein
MQCYIHSFTEAAEGVTFHKIFGYSSKGIPGLEVIGLGNKGKIIREKVIYFSKIFNLKIPAKRFVICLEQVQGKKLSNHDLSNFELPISILFWVLSGNLKILATDKCYAAGMLKAEGQLVEAIFSSNTLKKIVTKVFQEEGILISKKIEELGSLRSIDPKEILQSLLDQ